MGRFSTAAWLLLVWGCGGAPPPSTEGAPPPPVSTGPASARGSTEASADLGPEGGTLSLSNGARLEVHGLDGPVHVTFRAAPDARAFSSSETQRALGPVLSIEPELHGDLVISIPQVAIPDGFSAHDLALGMEEAAQGRGFDTLGTETRWQMYPAALEGGRLTAHLTGVAGHRVQFGVSR